MLKTLLCAAAVSALAGAASAATFTLSFETDDAGFVNLPNSNTGGAAVAPTSALPAGLPGFTVDADTFGWSGTGGAQGNISFDDDNRISISQNNEGLGVRNSFGDSNELDGFGSNDILVFKFDSAVRITQVIFENFDTFSDDDEFVFYRGPDANPNAVNARIFPLGFPDTDGDEGFRNFDFYGSVFGFGALDNNDNYRLSKITLEVVPLPAAGWMLLAGLGGLAAMRRKRS